MATRAEIVWSQTHRDQFLVVDNEMTLFKLDRYAVGELHSVTTNPLTQWISNSSTSTRLCTSHELSHHRCFDWHPRPTDLGGDLVAVGFANGRVLLTSPAAASSVSSSSHLEAIGDAAGTNGSGNLPGYERREELGTIGGLRVTGKEFLPKHSRPCQSIRWNPQHPQWLAIGLDRHRSDNGIFIWDIFSRSPSSIIPGSYESMSASLYHQCHNHQLAHPSYDTTSVGTQPTPVVIDHRRSHSGLSTGESGGNHVLQHQQQPTVSASIGSGPPQQQQHHTRALYEFAGGESAHSLIWLRNSPKCLACGLSGKCIRLYDTRDLSRFQLQIPTKAVYGLTVDPFSDQRLCSFADNQLFLWDLRHVEKPLLVISDQKPYIKIQWDPIRRNVFTSLSKDSTVVKVYHLQQIIAEETELSYTENHVQASFLLSDESSVPNWSPATVVSYDWHPQEECHLLCLSSQGAINDIWVNERLCAQWSPDGSRLLTSFGKLLAELKHFHLSDEGTPVEDKEEEMQQVEEDMAIVMQRRALLGYGTNEDNSAADDSRCLKLNAELCLVDGGTSAVTQAWTWLWMFKLKQLSECEQADTWPYDNSFPGVLQVLRSGVSSKPGCASNVEYRPMLGLEAASGHTSMFRVYSSGERDRIMQFCGWGSLLAPSKDRSFSLGAGSDEFFQDLLENQQAERAAAIALFTLRLKLAVQILTKAAFMSEDKATLQLTALALAGFPGAPSDREQISGSGVIGVVSTPTALTLNASSGTMQSSSVSPTSLWVDQCNMILPQLANPYLKAMFQFLACRATGASHFEPLLESTEFPLHDKVAFGAMFASDQRLDELVTSLTRQCVDRGDLCGLLLTGLGSDQSIDLIQKYVDTTGDVQTGALLIIYGSGAVSGGDVTPTSVSSSTAGAGSVAAGSSRDGNTINRIVDGYFTLLDSWGLWHVRAQTNALYLKRSQAVIGKPTSQVFITCTYCARSIWAGAGGRMRQRMHKLGSCPSCKKPLPRCALCRLNVGMPLASDQDTAKPNKFASWFAWCQSCRHGGHAQHLSDWFATNIECPVTGCSCKCAALDAMSDFSQLLLPLLKDV